MCSELATFELVKYIGKQESKDDKCFKNKVCFNGGKFTVIWP